MGEIPIKIKIADREYPMRVNPSEEERIRLAAKQLNEEIKAYKERFKIDDKQDLLAMVAFDSIIEKLRAEHKSFNTQASVMQKIGDLDTLVSSTLLE